MDQLAAKLDMDPAELRRRNFIAPDDFPHKTVAGATYDSGEYARALELVLEAAGYDELRAEQAPRRERGDVKQLGIGLCTYVELTGPRRRGRHLHRRRGRHRHGQDRHLAAGPGPRDDVGAARVVDARRADGRRAHRALRHAQGPARHGDDGLAHAAGRRQRDDQRHPRGAGQGQRARGAPARGRGRRRPGRPRPGPRRRGHAVGDDLLGRAGQGGRRPEPGCPRAWSRASTRSTTSRRPDSSYPFGAHIAVVEVDTETGLTKLIRHVTVDDSGNIANPLLAEGQIHGGIAQGVAQALYEEIAYDEDGNCVAGSLTSYALPTAAELPMFETSRTETPSPLNPLGAKGIGESGAIGATPAVWNAVVDALVAPGGREHRHAGDADAGVAGDRGGAERGGRGRVGRGAVAALRRAAVVLLCRGVGGQGIEGG